MLQKERNSSFELLRIISMFLIVMHHYALYGGFNFFSPFSTKLLFVQGLEMGGKLGLNLFVLISGFFLCKSNFKWQKLIKLEIEVIFYSVVIGTFFFIFYPERESLKELLGEFTPLRLCRYWFYNTYFVLILASPFINKLIFSLPKNEFRKLLLLIATLWVFIPVIPKVHAIEMSDLGWFVFLYLCAAYIRIYAEDFTRKTSTYILLGVSCNVLIFISAVLFNLLGVMDSRFTGLFSYFFPENSLLTFACSILLFIGVSKWDIGCKKGLNLFASTAFGIYLIHEHHVLGQFLWTDLFQNATFFSSDKLYIHAAIVISGVFIACALIDLVRQFAFEKPLFYVIKKIFTKDKE